MKIEYLRIKNFKALQDFEMREIPNFCVILGANGSGKSTLFNLFGFLKEAMNSNVQTALIKQGGSRGFEEVRSRGSTGNIEIELKFRIKKTAARDKNPLVTYSLSIARGEAYSAIVEKEILQYRRGQRGRPWKFLDFSKGAGTAVTNEGLDSTKEEGSLERDEQKLKSPNILAIKGLAQFEKFPSAVALGNLIENWHLSDIHINQARQEQIAGLAEHLSQQGENLSLVIDYLYKHHKNKLDEIIRLMKQRIPGIEDISTTTIETGQVLLKIKDKSFNDPFLVRFVSDGTIKMLAYLVLLHDPTPPHLLCVEEPENQLYPTLLEELAEEFRHYADRGGQVFVSTHSPDLLNAARPKEVFFLIKEDGYTSIKRASDDEQIVQYIKAGDKMGWLWKEGLFEGVSP